MTLSCPLPESRPNPKESAKEGRMRVPRWVLMIAIAGLAACASHRNDPPKCQGPFTPINPSSSAVTHGSQR
jgi:hypothetical protein